MGIVDSILRTAETPPTDMSASSAYILGEYCIPEIVTEILSHVPPEELLKCSLVCKTWNEIIKNNRLWRNIYKRKYPKRKPKKLPWFVYHTLFTTDFFDSNLIKNGGGKQKLKGWKVTKNLGNGFAVENPPKGCPALPLDVRDFDGFLGCFATSYGQCQKLQEISLCSNKVNAEIIRKFKPHIYVSDWTCGRFDCGSTYFLKVELLNANSVVHEEHRESHVEQWSDPQWTKHEIIIKDYSDDVTQLRFIHQGKDTLFWAGHYGSKMAGSTVKILFDSIQESNHND